MPVHSSLAELLSPPLLNATLDLAWCGLAVEMPSYGLAVEMPSYGLEEPDLLPSQRQTFSCFSGAGLQLSPGGESPSQLRAQEEMRMKTWLIFSVSVMKVTPECKVSNWVLSGIKKDKDICIVADAVPKGLLTIKTPFYMESLEVIRIVINFWSFLLRNNLPSFLKHSNNNKKV